MKYKQRKMIHIDSTLVGAFILLAFVGVLIYGLHKFDMKTQETEYNTITQQVRSYDTVLALQSDSIEEIRNDQYELSDELYQYTVEAVNGCDDEVIKRVFKKLFPTKQDFQKDDRKESVKNLYAFLDKYPEIKCDNMVLYAIGNIDTNKIELKNKVDMYNMNVEFYHFWAGEWNKSNYIVSKDGKVDASKYPYIEQQ